MIPVELHFVIHSKNSPCRQKKSCMYVPPTPPMKPLTYPGAQPTTFLGFFYLPISTLWLCIEDKSGPNDWFCISSSGLYSSVCSACRSLRSSSFLQHWQLQQYEQHWHKLIKNLWMKKMKSMKQYKIREISIQTADIHKSESHFNSSLSLILYELHSPYRIVIFGWKSVTFLNVFLIDLANRSVSQNIINPFHTASADMTNKTKRLVLK